MSEKKTLMDDEISTRTLSRRQMTMLGGAAAGALAALGLVSTTACCMGNGAATGSGCSDSDPSDGIGRGTHCAGGAAVGCSDSDPTDPAGHGSHCAGGAAGPLSGCSDSDPTDPAGNGSHCAGGAAPAPAPGT